MGQNPNLNIKDILDNPNIFCLDNFYKEHYFWKCLSCHKNIVMKDIIEHPEICWDYKYLSGNPNLDFNYVLIIKSITGTIQIFLLTL